MEGNLLLAIFALLAATVALVPLAKWAGLGTVLGYLAAGVLVGPFALRLVSDSDLIHQIADLGIVGDVHKVVPKLIEALQARG